LPGSEKAIKARSKGFKRRVVSLATAITTLILYVPFMDSPWAIYVAMCAGCTIAVFGLVWSDGMLRRIPGGEARPLGHVLEAHLAFLAMVILWIWFAQWIKPALPDWVVIEGNEHESWYLVFALLGIVGLLVAELSWLSSKPGLEKPYDHSAGK